MKATRDAWKAGQPTLDSTSTDITVAWAPGSPTVTINQAAGQVDPTSTSPINFTVVFSIAVTGFTTGDVTIAGTAGGTKTATVSSTSANDRPRDSANRSWSPTSVSANTER